jgi:hypothetical protein
MRGDGFVRFAREEDDAPVDISAVLVVSGVTGEWLRFTLSLLGPPKKRLSPPLRFADGVVFSVR